MLDCIIVGQGIAGTCLAMALREKGFNLLVMQNSKLSNASKVAAGLIQPITGRYLTSHKLINSNYSLLLNFYKNLEKKLNSPLIKPMKTYLYLTEEQEKTYKKKSKNPLFRDQLKPHFTNKPYLNIEKNEYELSNVYVVDTQKLLDLSYTFLLNHNNLVEENFELNGLKFHNDYVSYKHYQAKYLIFCTGSHLSPSTFIKKDYFKKVRGEVLMLNKYNHSSDYILQTNKWCVPVNKNQFKFGSTYVHDLDLLPSKDSWEYLNSCLKDFNFNSTDISSIQSGIRLFSKNRLPQIGFSNQHRLLGLFSAFGSKGFSFAPILSKLWADSFPDLPSTLLEFRYD